MKALINSIFKKPSNDAEPETTGLLMHAEFDTPQYWTEYFEPTDRIKA